jgi:7,8-dihydro-6-hydroxymethylpterin-pyrophosphokinase
MTLHIGCMMPDRSLDESALVKAITKIATDLARLRDQHVQKRTPDLNIVFLLPSRQEKANFTGLRLHSFDDAS